MPRTTDMTPALQALLFEQDQVVTLEQLMAHGFGPDAVQYRVSRGQWRRLLPGVLLASASDPSRRQRLVAACLWAGPGAAVDACDACVWYGLRLPSFRPDSVHVVVPQTSSARSRGFVLVRRASAEIIIGAHGLVPYVDRATAVLAAGRTAKSTAAAVSIFSRALQTELVTTDQLASTRELLGDKWCSRVDKALEAVGVGVRSPAESVTRNLILTSLVLPEPKWNQWLDLGDGGNPVCADALWKNAGMVNEVLGRKYHAWAEQFESTEARRARLVSVGLVVQGCTANQARHEGAAVLSRLERTYAQHAGRGMPTGVRLIEPPRPIAA